MNRTDKGGAVSRALPFVRRELPFVRDTPPLRRDRNVPDQYRGKINEVVPVEVHDLVPRGHEVVHELLLRVVARVDLRERPQLGVRAEDEVDAAAGPPDLAGGAVAALERLRVAGTSPSTACPCRAG